MRILRRLFVWFLETLCEALLLCVFLISFSYFSTGGRNDLSASKFGFVILGISILFMAKTGYLLTTAIVRMVWTNRTLWLHPVISVALFSVHLEIFFFVTGGLNASERLAIGIGGAAIVFSCTFVGGYILRSWEKRNDNDLGNVTTFSAA